MLTIAEEWLVLALDGETGKVRVNIATPAEYLRAAELMELVLRDQLTSSDGRPGELRVSDASPTGDQVLDNAMTEIARLLPSTIEDVFDELPDPLEQLLARLVDSDVLRTEERKRLGFTSRRYFLTSPDLRASILSRLPPAGTLVTTSDVRTAGLNALEWCGSQEVGEDALGHLRETSGRATLFIPDLLREDGSGPIGSAMAAGLNDIIGPLVLRLDIVG